mmetsp:Transcript_15061/g.22417  ORF Transcript_15061/g.22417 Transcript_15061/m.22417 type:complete len:177 (-) Transcript_15061:43-573(-)
MLEHLRKYKEEHGDCLVPGRCALNPSLGKWVNNQRTAYRRMLNGEKSNMTEERISLLSRLGFVWVVEYYDKWPDMFEELKKYKETHGHCSVPAKHPSTKRLALWVQTQRHYYSEMKKGISTPMTAERTDLLNSIGFVWKVRKDNWHEMLDDSRKCQEEYGDYLVPGKNAPNRSLGY